MLIRIFKDKKLKDISNLCILNLKEKTVMYSFHIKDLKGYSNCAADTLSRCQLLQDEPDETDLAERYLSQLLQPRRPPYERRITS